MSSQEYLDSMKVSVYLQDAIKVILDRRQERPLETLVEYFSTTLRGEHILLREYAFVSATNVNRRCFLQQVKKVFHTTPYFKVVTALDYHQMLCLICSDFPRSLMIEAVRTIPLMEAPLDKEFDVAGKSGDQLLFEKFDLNTLQRTIAVFFFFNEFMEAVRAMFLELQGAGADTLNIHSEQPIAELFQMIKNYDQRQRPASSPVPPLEILLEIFLGEKCKKLAEKEVLLLPEEAKGELEGLSSYLDFAQQVAKNAKIIRLIYEPVYNKKLSSLQDTLKDMASDPEIMHTHGKKGKGKKKKI